ncbi:helix-turn-helix transcriptional regulator [Candidatus Poriferisodalis sp.]|uniref:helix-turn-helix transcriptional regulator n=1 Tax=Candidatus Poriferisodalis sp. TaxID=3101277 RepID=UPI003B01EAE9
MSQLSTAVKIERLLAIIPWVTERGGATVGDIAERFGLQPDAVYDLLFGAMCYEVVGAGAYENLGIAVFGTDDGPSADQPSPHRRSLAESSARETSTAWVHVEPGAMLDRPLNLSVPQAFGILTAGQSALALRGADRSGALATALDKLRAAYGERVNVSVDLAPPSCLSVLQNALGARSTVSIHYYTPHSDTISERRVDPLDVSLQDGHWYLQGWCHLRRDIRLFRVDRIEECSDTGERHDRQLAARAAAAAPPAESDETTDVVLSVPRGDLWRVESYPAHDVQDDGERCIVTYAIRSPRVLGQMLLRLGAETQVVNAAELPREFAEEGRRPAAAILALYEPQRPNASSSRSHARNAALGPIASAQSTRSATRP